MSFVDDENRILNNSDSEQNNEQKLPENPSENEVLPTNTPSVESTPQAESGPVPQTVEGLASFFSSNMPSVEPYIQNKMDPRPNPKNGGPIPQGFENKTDRYGRFFNPELHQTDENGNPILTRDGNLKRKCGRPRLEEVKIKTAEEIESEALEAQAQAKQAQTAETCMVVSAMCVNTLEVLTVGLFGDEWALGHHEQLKCDERQFLTAQTASYLMTKPDMDIPPGMLLFLTVGMVYAPRLTKPKTKTKLQQIKDWLIGKWFAFKSRNKKVKFEDTHTVEVVD